MFRLSKVAAILSLSFLSLSSVAADGEALRTAKDGAVMQTADPSMPTRVLKEGIPILMHFGDKVIPGSLMTA